MRGVVRKETADGPAIGRAIVVNAPIARKVSSAQVFADGDGRFELPRPYRRMLVYARDPSGSFAGFAIVGDDDGAEVTIVARPAAAARGRVVDGAGLPYDGMRVAYSVWPRDLDVEGFEAQLNGCQPMNRAGSLRSGCRWARDVTSLRGGRAAADCARRSLWR